MIAVYVPAPDVDLGIARGSGIVGRQYVQHEPREELLLVYYEGNVYGGVGLERYANRVHQAWGRMEQSYPTVARQHVRPFEMVEVAAFDPFAGLVEVSDLPSLLGWLDLAELDPAELVVSR